MRLQFQAWDTHSELMLTWSDIFRLDQDGLYPFLNMIEDGRHIVRQFTGLLDRNGKEIYEGDIVQSTLTSRQIGKVIFEDGIYKVLWSKNNPFNDEYDSFLHNVIRSSEVIGNIYENSELINS